MLRPRENSATVILLLILFIFIFFISQAALQKREEPPFPVPQGGDLAVVGGSTAALIAALEAAGAGAQVFIFPNGKEILEDTAYLVSEGLAASSTPVQEEQDVVLSSEDLQKILQEKGKGVADPQLLEAFTRQADGLYDLARQYGGVEFDILPDAAGNPYFHLATGADAGEKFKGQLLDRVEKAGVVFRSEKVRKIQLLQSGVNERVQSLLLENNEGELFNFYVQGVILADGGYSGDIHRLHGYLPRDNLVALRPEQKGEGLQLALELNAGFVQTDFLKKKILLVDFLTGEVQKFPPEQLEDVLFFNSEGQVLSGQVPLEESADFILRSPEGAVFVLAPEEMALAENDYFHFSASPEELLKTCKLKEYPLFPVPFSYLSSYYTASVKVGVEYTPGGLPVTPRGEVKNEEGEIIQGLYAAGEIAGGLHGEGMLPGMALSETLFLSGRAGRFAAEYARR